MNEGDPPFPGAGRPYPQSCGRRIARGPVRAVIFTVFILSLIAGLSAIRSGQLWSLALDMGHSGRSGRGLAASRRQDGLKGRFRAKFDVTQKWTYCSTTCYIGYGAGEEVEGIDRELPT